MLPFYNHPTIFMLKTYSQFLNQQNYFNKKPLLFIGILSLGLFVNTSQARGSETQDFVQQVRGYITLAIQGKFAKDDAIDSKGTTPLMAAAFLGYTNHVLKLINLGTNLNQKRKSDGVTALMLAAQNGYVNIVKTLLENGADSSLKSTQGSTALECACRNQHKNVVALLRTYSAIPEQSQFVLKFYLASYLNTFSNHDLTFVERFKNTNGICNGLTSLWLYSKWKSTQKIDNNEYNNYWFQHTIQALINWDNSVKPNQNITQNLEDFATLIDFFQYPESYYPGGSQLDLATMLTFSKLETQGKTLKRDYIIAATLTKLQLYKLLIDVVHDNDLVRISYNSNNNFHTVGLFKQSQQYYYYDSNNSEGEIKLNSLDEVIDTIIAANEQYSKNSSPIVVEVYSFDPNNFLLQPYDVLKNNNAPATGEALIIAAYFGATDSVKFYLEHGVSADSVDSYGWTALMYATYNKNFEVLKILTEKTGKK